MHSKTLFATVTIGFAIACYATPQHLRAQTTYPQSPDTAAQPSSTDTQSQNADLSQARNEAAQMVPAQARLEQNLDSKSVQAGQQFKAVLQDKVHLKDGVELPKGTALLGTVATEPAPMGAKSELALRFTQADLKNGQTIPIQATIVGVTPPQMDENATSEMLYNAPPDSWDGRTVSFDVSNALSGIDLHSKIAGQNSGSFVSTKSNLKLGVRTQIALAIGPQNHYGSNGGY